jgi:predicted nucleic acid-binding protein
MRPLVVDASVAGAWLLPDEHSGEGEGVLERLLAAEVELAVPALWIYEMTNLLLSALRRGRIDEAGVGAAHRLLDLLPRQSFDHETALARERTTRIALRFDLSAYDAAYLELADRLQCPLETYDGRLAGAARAMGVVGGSS